MAFWGIEMKGGESVTYTRDQVKAKLRITQATWVGITSNVASEACLVQCRVGNRSPIPLCAFMIPNRASTGTAGGSINLDLEFEETEDVVFSVVATHDLQCTVYLTGFYVTKPLAIIGAHENIGAQENVVDPVDIAPQVEERQKKECEERAIKVKVEPLDDTAFSDALAFNPTAAIYPMPTITVEEIQQTDHAVLPPGPEVNMFRINDILDQLQEQHQGVKSDNNVDSIIRNIAHEAVSQDLAVLNQDDDDDDGHSQPQNMPDLSVTSKRKRGNDPMNDNNSYAIVKDNNVEEDNNKHGVVVVQPDQGTREHQLSILQGCNQVDDHESKKMKKEALISVALDNVVNSDPGIMSDDSKPKIISETTLVDSGSIKKKSKKKKKKNKKSRNGFAIEEVVKGKPNGEVAAIGSKVNFYLIGKLMDTEKVYYSNLGEAPIDLILGDKGVIDGLNAGIDGMLVGDKRRLIIPPSMGYGESGCKSLNVPPNSWLLLEIELVGVGN